jgi:hypothetical protein
MRLLHAVLTLVLVLGCLPAETREQPGTLALTIRTAPGSFEPDGKVSHDGWTLHFERYLVGLGSAELQGDNCEAYSEGGYGRILDMTRDEAQPLSVAFGLGRCDLALQVSGPRWDSVLGAGVDPEVASLLALPGTDTVRDDSPVSIFVEGRATLGAHVKRFAWPFRAEIIFESCRATNADGTAQLFTLRSGQRLPVELVFNADALFQDHDQVLFGPFAAADDAGDSDGTVTLSELATDAPLFEQLYFERLPTLVQLPMGTCSHRINAEDDD